MISSTTNRVSYAGDGSSATFSFPYEFFAQADLKVYFYNSSTNAATLQTLNTNYTIGGTANAQGVYTQGGSVIVTCAVPSTMMVVIYRDGSQVQNYSLLQNGQINSVALVQQLDYITLLLQRLQDLSSRSVRLADGFGPTFDPTLPVNIGTSPSKFLVTNSSATGLIFSDTNGAAYIPNTVIQAVSATQIGSIGGSPAGYVLSSNGSSAPGWAPVSLSGSSVSGTLTLGNGGTGGLVPQTWGVVYASSATQLATTDPAPTGVPLISNASSAPSFQKLNLSSAGSGILPVVNGGTGVSVLAPQYGVIYMSSATQASVIASAQAGFVLTANGSSAPSFQAVAIANSGVLLVANGGTGVPSLTPQYGIPYMSSATQMSIVPSALAGLPLLAQGSSAPLFGALNLASAGSGILPIANGGTGVPSLAPQYGVIYMSSATQAAVVPSATSGTVLTANGSSAPTFQAVTVSPIAPTSVSANYTALTTDQVILCNSSNYTVVLYNPTGNSGRQVILKKQNVSGPGITIVGSSCTIDGSSAVLDFQYESVILTNDGANWYVVDRYQPAPQVSLAITGTSWVTVFAVGVYYKTGEGLWRLRFNCAGTSTSLASETVVFASTTFGGTLIGANRQSVSANDNSGGAALTNGFVDGNTANLSTIFGAGSTNRVISGDVSLTGKPGYRI